MAWRPGSTPSGPTSPALATPRQRPVMRSTKPSKPSSAQRRAAIRPAEPTQLPNRRSRVMAKPVVPERARLGGKTQVLTVTQETSAKR